MRCIAQARLYDGRLRKDKTKDADDGGADLAGWLASRSLSCRRREVIVICFHVMLLFPVRSISSLPALSAPRFARDSEMHVGLRYSMTLACGQAVRFVRGGFRV